jgi:UDP-glucose 4-epimerase
MGKNKVILVTGIAGYWGRRVAANLVMKGHRVIGVDSAQPANDLKGLDFILADVRNPLFSDLLEVERVDTVCHLAFMHSTRRSETAFDANVMGTTRLLGACARAGVGRVVLKSSTAVYGARATNSAFLTESHPLRGSRRYGYTRDMVEIETFCNGFSRRVPDVAVTNLRFSSIVGPTADTPMVRLLKTPWAPRLMGFDPMMQIIHEDDVVSALVHAVSNDCSGAFNVAAPDVLPLSKVCGLVGKLPFSVFHMCAGWAVTLLGTARLDVDRYLPVEPSYLRFPWVGDLTRMEKQLGFVPQYSAVEVLREFAAQFRLGRYRAGPVSLAQDADHMRKVIERRRRALSGAGTEAEGGGDE